MKISNETRDRLVKDLSNDELKQELASRRARKPGLYLRDGETLVVLFSDNNEGVVVVAGQCWKVGHQSDAWSDYHNAALWSPVTLIVKE